MKNSEIWKGIPDFIGLYEASNLGEIKSIEKVIDGRWGKTYKQEKILKPFKNKKGYLYVSLSKNGKAKSYQVHRLIAKTFLPNPQNKTQVNHIDNNHSNNNVDNLEWVTPKENIIHCWKNGYRKSVKGINNINSKQIIQYDKNNNKIKEWGSVGEASRILGIDGGTICACCKKKKYHKTAGGYKWEYKESEEC